MAEHENLAADVGNLQSLSKLRAFFRNEKRHANELCPDIAIRISMAKGVELLVDPDLDMPSPKDLVEIALLIRKTFGEP